MSLVKKNLWSNILWSSTDSVGPFSHNLSKSKVNEFEEAVISNHDVFRLEISVDYIFIMEVFKYSDYLGPIKSTI